MSFKKIILPFATLAICSISVTFSTSSKAHYYPYHNRTLPNQYSCEIKAKNI